MVEQYKGYTIAGSGTVWIVSKNSRYIARAWTEADAREIVEQLTLGNNDK